MRPGKWRQIYVSKLNWEIDQQLEKVLPCLQTIWERGTGVLEIQQIAVGLCILGGLQGFTV